MTESTIGDVEVSRKGQITIPVKLRAKYKLRPGTKLLVFDTGEGIRLKPKASSLYDAAGSGSSEASVKQMKRLLNRLRKEDA